MSLKTDIMDNNIIFFQPPGIKKQYCEVGFIMDNDNDYIYYANEPCKVLKTDVKIIDAKDIYYEGKIIKVK